MWNTRRDDRDTGGPVLRDPLANRNRAQAQPYNTFNFKNRQPNHQNNNIGNLNDGFNSITKVGGGGLFPPAIDEAIFPPISQPQAPSPFLQQQAPLLQLPLGFNPDVAPQINAPIIFQRSIPPPTYGNNNAAGNVPFNFQSPSQVLPPPPPPLLPNPAGFQSQDNGPFSDHNFDNTFERRQQPPTLDLQPQWSVNNGGQRQWAAKNDIVQRSSLHGNVNNQLSFNDRQPFNSIHQESKAMTSAGRGRGNNNPPPFENNFGRDYDRRPNFNQQHLHQQQPEKPQMFEVQSQRSISSFGDTDTTPNNSRQRFRQSHASSNLSYPSSRYQNTQQEVRPSTFESQVQRPIPSLLNNRNGSSGFNSGSNKKPFEKNSKGQHFNPQFQKKAAKPFETPSGTNTGNGNNISLTSNKPRSGPLLPTPKLIPYPPPPLNPRSSNMPTATLSRNPRGILKNSSSNSYSNFVRESNALSSSENSPSAVVPYDIGDDDDDDDDNEFISEVQNSEGSSSNMTHDFFSEKIVKHFASILAGKSMEEQLDNLLKYLVLPADFLATRVSIVRNLHVMLRDTFQNCIVQPYGADFIGVGNSDDSVNVFVDLTGKQGSSSQIDARVIEPLEVTKETVDELLNLIQEDKNHKFFGQIIRRTNFSQNRINLPVISFIQSETKVRCNIRLDNYLLVQEAKVIQFVCSLDTRIPSMLAVIRYWSSCHKVLDTPEEDTKNRFVTLLLLFFLARKKIIPTMSHLQSLCVNREYFNNLEIGFCDDYSLVPPNDNPALEDKTVFTLSTLSLLKEFFKLFADAKFKKEVVSLWKAEFIPKENFTPELEGKVLAPDLRKRYRYGVNGKLRSKRIDCGSKLCIQCFQDLSENLTIAVAEYDVSKFQVECNSACKKLESIMTSGSGNLMDLFEVSEYASYGTPEHREMHPLVYFLYYDADKRNLKQGTLTVLSI